MTLRTSLETTRPISPDTYEPWSGETCIGVRYRDELKPELTEGLKVGGCRTIGDNVDRRVIRVS